MMSLQSPISGLSMPPIIYGTAWKKDRTADLVEQALKAGFRGIDTACQPKHYHEPGVGEGLVRALLSKTCKRDDVYIQTKFTPLAGQDPKRIPYDPEAPLGQQVRQSFDVSLKNIRIDRLDGLVLHSPLKNPADLQTVWRAMEDLVQSHLVGQIGISNCYDPALLKTLYTEARVKPALIQNRFYAQTGYDQDIRAFCQQTGMVYQSFWTLTANPKILAHNTTQSLSKKYGLGVEQLFFRFLSQLGIQPLTGTTSSQHMTADLKAFDITLSDADIRALRPLIA